MTTNYYKCFRILKVDKARLQVFWEWDFKNTLKICLKQFNSSGDSWETAVADRPLWLAALGTEWLCLNGNSSFSAVLTDRPAGQKFWKLMSSPCILFISFHAFQRRWCLLWQVGFGNFLEYFLGWEAVWLPVEISLADWGQNHGEMGHHDGQI